MDLVTFTQLLSGELAFLIANFANVFGAQLARSAVFSSGIV
jgi:hypothetical protein